MEEGQAYHRMDVLWHYLSSLQLADNHFYFLEALLHASVYSQTDTDQIPYYVYDAKEERLFSMAHEKKKQLYMYVFDPAMTPN